MGVLKAINIKKSFGKLNVLNGVNLTIDKGEIVSIVGPSGAGKTTLIQILGSLDRPDEGEVYFQKNKLSDLKGKKLNRFRNQNIGFVFQFHHLLPEFTALENICIPAFIAGNSKKQAKNKAIELLKELQIFDRMKHKPSELSGGEKQRVAVARALINNPMIIFADEPSGNLDTKNREALHDLFFILRKKYNQGYVIVTHDTNLAKKSDRIINLKDGKIVNK